MRVEIGNLLDNVATINDNSNLDKKREYRIFTLYFIHTKKTNKTEPNLI